MDEFQVGDVVTWTSQSAGTTRKKEGTIIARVEPAKDPRKAVEAAGHNFYKYRTKTWGGGMTRGHVSYVVAVPPTRGKGMSFLYWPLANKLRLKRPASQVMVPDGPPGTVGVGPPAAPEPPVTVAP